MAVYSQGKFSAGCLDALEVQSTMVSRTKSEPLYHQVTEEIRRRVTSGEWRPGDRVPSERRLAELLDVSRITVRHAVRLAVADGLLTQQRGVGTFVGAATRLEQDLFSIRSFERTLAEQGQVATTDIDRSEITMSNLALAGTLEISPSALVYNLRLLGRGDSSPVVFYDSYFSVDLGRQVAAAAQALHTDGQAFSTLDLYRSEGLSRYPTALSQTIEAMAAPRDLAARLAVDEDAPVLVIDSVMTDEGGTLEFRRAYYRADRYKFGVQRRLGSMT